MIEEKIGRARLLKMAIAGIDSEINRVAKYMDRESELHDNAAEYVTEISTIRAELVSELSLYDKSKNAQEQ